MPCTLHHTRHTDHDEPAPCTPDPATPPTSHIGHLTSIHPRTRFQIKYKSKAGDLGCRVRFMCIERGLSDCPSRYQYKAGLIAPKPLAVSTDSRCSIYRPASPTERKQARRHRTCISIGNTWRIKCNPVRSGDSEIRLSNSFVAETNSDGDADDRRQGAALSDPTEWTEVRHRCLGDSRPGAGTCHPRAQALPQAGKATAAAPAQATI